MNKAVAFATFVAGAVIGSVTTWYFTKKKYEQIADEEIESVKKRFTYKPVDKSEDDSDISEKDFDEAAQQASIAREKPSVAEYAKHLSKEGYTNYSSPEKKEEMVDDNKTKAPYVISPDEFGEFDEYDTIGLTYYSDHILTDENDEMLEDVEGAVGFESLNHFGEYDDDAVYVRNDRLKVDYEILLDQRKYSDILEEKPYLRGM